jgi:hypothetical protein
MNCTITIQKDLRGKFEAFFDSALAHNTIDVSPVSLVRKPVKGRQLVAGTRALSEGTFPPFLVAVSLPFTLVLSASLPAHVPTDGPAS